MRATLKCQFVLRFVSRKSRVIVPTLIASNILIGCASVTKGTSQNISFDISPVSANCVLQLEGKSALGTVSGGDDSITVKKNRENILAICSSPGFETSTYVIKSSADRTALMGTAIDFGITDMITGAMWLYPERVQVALRPSAESNSNLAEHSPIERKDTSSSEQVLSKAEDFPSPSVPSIKPYPAESSLSLTVTSSTPDSDGVVILDVTTNSSAVSLRVNGDEVSSNPKGAHSLKRFAQVGENFFEVVATDRFGNITKEILRVTREAADTSVKFAALNPYAVQPRPVTDAVAVIIGIEEYRRVPNAEFANNDARFFYDYAVRGLGVKPENIKLLLDQEADDVGILGALQNWLPLKARKGQTDVYVFYSGHGLPSDDGASLYLLPHGVDRQFLDRTAIKQSELVEAIQRTNPRSVTMFIDSCYSGQTRTGETLLASARPISVKAKQSSFPSNFTVISASAPDQISSSSPELRHGIFSYYLMRGMEGEADANGDSQITVAEMQAYLSEQVPRQAMSMNRNQQPKVVGDQSRVLVGR